MLTAKEEVKKILDQLPDDVSYEDIQYHIYVREKIERGLNDIRDENILSQEEVEKKMSKWLGQ
jgi:cell division protein FtsX